MNKRIAELRNQIEALKAEARQLIDEDKIKEAREKANEAKALQEKLDLILDLEDEDTNNGTQLSAGELKDQREQEKLYKNAFMKAFRRKKLTADDRAILEAQNALTESADADGGLLVPKDIQTKINEYKRSLVDLSQLATIEPVTTLSGSRVLEKLATMTPFENITDDTADIPEMASPQFEAITYSVKKYAGWLPIPNDLLKDSDQNIIEYLKRWIGKKSVVTNNTLFLGILNSLTPKVFDDYKDIKKALNVTLDPMHAVNAKILTNQDGFNYLDSLEGSDGRPLLQVDVTNPTQKLFAGKPVVVAPNSILPTTGTETLLAPIFIGDFKEGVIKFERQGYEIASTNIGGTAFRKDRTEMRVIEKQEYNAWDTAAIVYGQIDVTSM